MDKVLKCSRRLLQHPRFFMLDVNGNEAFSVPYKEDLRLVLWDTLDWRGIKGKCLQGECAWLAINEALTHEGCIEECWGKSGHLGDLDFFPYYFFCETCRQRCLATYTPVHEIMSEEDYVAATLITPNLFDRKDPRLFRCHQCRSDVYAVKNVPENDVVIATVVKLLESTRRIAV